MVFRNCLLLIGLLLITQNVSATVLSNDFFGRSGQPGSFVFPQGFPNFGGFNFFGNQQPRSNPQSVVPSPNPQTQSPVQQPKETPRPQPEVLSPQFNPSIQQNNQQALINPLQPQGNVEPQSQQQQSNPQQNQQPNAQSPQNQQFNQQQNQAIPQQNQQFNQQHNQQFN
jgi:hypothetical protein